MPDYLSVVRIVSCLFAGIFYLLGVVVPLCLGITVFLKEYLHRTRKTKIPPGKTEFMHQLLIVMLASLVITASFLCMAVSPNGCAFLIAMISVVLLFYYLHVAPDTRPLQS